MRPLISYEAWIETKKKTEFKGVRRGNVLQRQKSECGNLNSADEVEQETAEKFLKAEENIRKKRQSEMLKILRNREARLLKREDLIINAERDKRVHFNRLQNSLDKKQRVQERINLLKAQQEILQKVRLEAALHSKLERERIFGTLSTHQIQSFTVNPPQINVSPKKAAYSEPVISSDKGVFFGQFLTAPNPSNILK